MLRNNHQQPVALPILSRGKHRSPRKGACFMEFASLVAGERWSDHPACTHRVLAVAVLSCDRVLAELDGRPVGALEEQSRSALAQVPHAARWAEHFISAAQTAAISPKRFCLHAAPMIVHDAAQGIAQAYVPDPDPMLRDLLVQGIDTCSALAGRAPDRDAVLTEP